MNSQAINLNDIDNEPSDKQLPSLMSEVVIETHKKAGVAGEQMMNILRKEISRANQIEGL